jgi:hypothetical protein
VVLPRRRESSLNAEVFKIHDSRQDTDTPISKLKMLDILILDGIIILYIFCRFGGRMRGCRNAALAF